MHVLIVDDSAVVRQTVAHILDGEPDVTVAAAADPIIAQQKIAAQRPDVILLDLEMPRMDGLTFLRNIMATDPIPVVVCSAIAAPRSDPALRALQDGALDIVAKPKIGLRDFLNESRVTLVDALRAAASARVAVPEPVRRSVQPRTQKPSLVARPEDRHIIAVGASTGGTEALRAILSRMPGDAAATVIVQHMPEGFTAQFARHLNADSAMEVKEAEHGDRIMRGRALIAPGNRHLAIARDRHGYYATLSDGPFVSRHRPSVDVLFQSVAETAGMHAIGVILTGMGADGAEGMVRMKRAGARTIAQDERTSVVFGMPKEAIARDAVDEVLPLTAIAGAIGTTSSS